MKTISLSISQKLAAAAVALGFVALFGPDPYVHSYAKINLKDLSSRADQQADRIEVLALAEMLMKGTNEVQLIDLRPATEFAAGGGLPGAINLSIPELLGAGDMKTANLLLYSKDDMQAAQAWVLARSTGFQSVRVVAGGLKDWNNEVLYPTLATATTPDGVDKLERRKHVSLYFGGAPRIAGAAAVSQISSPKAAVKTAPGTGSAGGAAKPKKKREGC